MSALHDWAEVTAWLPGAGHAQRERPLARHACALLSTRLATRTCPESGGDHTPLQGRRTRNS